MVFFLVFFPLWILCHCRLQRCQFHIYLMKSLAIHPCTASTKWENQSYHQSTPQTRLCSIVFFFLKWSDSTKAGNYNWAMMWRLQQALEPHKHQTKKLTFGSKCFNFRTLLKKNPKTLFLSDFPPLFLRKGFQKNKRSAINFVLNVLFSLSIVQTEIKLLKMCVIPLNPKEKNYVSMCFPQWETNLSVLL